jgi:hypothetical protein
LIARYANGLFAGRSAVGGSLSLPEIGRSGTGVRISFDAPAAREEGKI